MTWKKEEYGCLKDKKQVYLYTMSNENGVSASFITLGATWVSMIVPDKYGKSADVVQGFDNLEGYLSNTPHFGAPIGRNANRIGNAAFKINDIEYKLAANSKMNNLHSGPDLYHNRIWDSEVSETGLGTCLTFSMTSPDGDQGYPGNAEIAISYTLTSDDSIIINYRMVSDSDTIANFTNHSYFNLAGNDSGDIMNQEVMINSNFFTITDKNLIPTGELAPVAGTPMDFTSWKAIGAEINADYEPLVLAGGYDHNWVISSENEEVKEVNFAAAVRDDESGRSMKVYTDLPGVQFYTANFLKDIEGKGGYIYKKRSSYCFETQYYPNAVNIPSFPSPVLKAGEEFNSTTVYKFNY